MTKTTAAIFSLPLLLTACWGGSTNATLQSNLENPLYAEWYYQDLVDHLVNLEIQNDKVLEDSDKKSIVDDARREGLEKAKAATRTQDEGLKGVFRSDREFVRGEALLLKDMLYLGPDFDAIPSIDLRLYLSTVIDPRDAAFPDPTALDLGSLSDPYGAQSYEVPLNSTAEAGTGSTQPQTPAYRSLVLWDAELEMLYGFAQLQDN